MADPLKDRRSLHRIAGSKHHRQTRKRRSPERQGAAEDKEPVGLFLHVAWQAYGHQQTRCIFDSLCLTGRAVELECTNRP